jgi:hypothetical protein
MAARWFISRSTGGFLSNSLREEADVAPHLSVTDNEARVSLTVNAAPADPRDIQDAVERALSNALYNGYRAAARGIARADIRCGKGCEISVSPFACFLTNSVIRRNLCETLYSRGTHPIQVRYRAALRPLSAGFPRAKQIGEYSRWRHPLQPDNSLLFQLARFSERFLQGCKRIAPFLHAYGFQLLTRLKLLYAVCQLPRSLPGRLALPGSLDIDG